MPKTRLEQLRSKLAASEKLPGYEKRCKAIRAEIEALVVAGLEFDL